MATDLLPLHPTVDVRPSNLIQGDVNNGTLPSTEGAVLPDINWDSYNQRGDHDLPSLSFNTQGSPIESEDSSNHLLLPPLDLGIPTSDNSLPLPYESSVDSIALPHSSLQGSMPSQLPDIISPSSPSSVLYTPSSFSSSSTDPSCML